MRLFPRKAKKNDDGWQTITSFSNGSRDDMGDQLHGCLIRPSEVSEWLLGRDFDALDIFGNRRIAEFFNVHFEGREVRRRFAAYNKYIEMDKDRIRVHGKFYNNIYLGRRIFGPARKQAFCHTIVGGMERRFEIIDNQINHIPFSHEASDRFPDKCRNSRIKCRDDTRVVLRSLVVDQPEDDFVHANHIKSSILFNDFIMTQAPMENTIRDFWRMVWQEQARYIFMLIGRKDANRCVQYWPKKAGGALHLNGLEIVNEGVDPSPRDSLFRVTRILVIGPGKKELRLEHWQADLNNSENVESPLQLLRLARGCTRPTIVHDCLGVSRAACLLAAELCITQLIRGPLYKHPVQRAVHYLRSMRAFAIETPMQYIFVHRIVQNFIRPLVGVPSGFRRDYARWLDERSQRFFLDDFNRAIPAYCLISPSVDPDLLRLVRHRERPEPRRELHAHVGELPLPVVESGAAFERKMNSVTILFNNVATIGAKKSTGSAGGAYALAARRSIIVVGDDSIMGAEAAVAGDENASQHNANNAKAALLSSATSRARVYSASGHMPKRYPRGRRYY